MRSQFGNDCFDFLNGIEALAINREPHRATLGSAEAIRLDSAPAQVALFRYDNNAFIVQNYLPAAAEVTVSIAGTMSKIHDLPADTDIIPAAAAGNGFGGRRPTTSPPHTTFAFTVLPHSYRAFAAGNVSPQSARDEGNK